LICIEKLFNFNQRRQKPCLPYGSQAGAPTWPFPRGRPQRVPANVSIFILVNQFCNGQILIDRDSALKMAYGNGLKQGLDPPEIELIDSVTWEIRSLLCDDDYEDFQVIRVNKNTGEIIKSIGYIKVYPEFNIQIKTEIKLSKNIESLQIAKYKKTAYQLNEFNDERENNPVVSKNNKWIAFEYGFRKIGLVNINGNNFKHICDECLYPEWIDNEWIAYFKDFEHIYKKNIYSNDEIRITKQPYRYDNFKISPDLKWIAYISSEVWPQKDSLGNPILRIALYGEDNDLCLLSLENGEKKFITKVWENVGGAFWSSTGDSLFFYISNKKQIAVDLE